MMVVDLFPSAAGGSGDEDARDQRIFVLFKRNDTSEPLVKVFEYGVETATVTLKQTLSDASLGIDGFALSASKGGRAFAVTARDGMGVYYDSTGSYDFSLIYTLAGDFRVEHVAMSPDGQWVLVADLSHVLHLIKLTSGSATEVNTWTPPAPPPGESVSITCIGWSTDSQHFFFVFNEQHGPLDTDSFVYTADVTSSPDTITILDSFAAGGTDEAQQRVTAAASAGLGRILTMTENLELHSTTKNLSGGYTTPVGVGAFEALNPITKELGYLVTVDSGSTTQLQKWTSPDTYTFVANAPSTTADDWWGWGAFGRDDRAVVLGWSNNTAKDMITIHQRNGDALVLIGEYQVGLLKQLKSVATSDLPTFA